MLELSYYGLSLVMLILLIFFYQKALKKYFDDEVVIKKKLLVLIGGLGVYLVYILGLSTGKVLTDFSLPPKLPLFLLPPFVAFLIFFYRKNKENKFIQSIPLQWTTYPQSFRILVEMLLLYTFYRGFIPEAATFEGCNFDIVMGVLAIPVAYFLAPQKQQNKTLLQIWNVLGIFMVLFVAFIIVSSIYQPQLWGSETPLVSSTFLTLPYLLIPALLAPLAIFLHVVSLIQLREKAD